ncbi:multiple epidermal growth factor-like domains protein 10 [Haliotis rufescens]|uniref:multiple epidermal growth factor-like domains protein 10 n=1 Tax=Haliotis rufescens TaxID=6454 RepID=UPI00201FA621|nr:multiple epidermal growth factor-like domains protein 10 [Haliotis rufescens]
MASQSSTTTSNQFLQKTPTPPSERSRPKASATKKTRITKFNNLKKHTHNHQPTNTSAIDGHQDGKTVINLSSKNHNQQHIAVLAKVSPTGTHCTNCDGNTVTCVDGVCLPRCVSVTSSGKCRCLDSRFYGYQCEHDCPDTCFHSRCQMDNSRAVCTEGCVAGKKGDNCDVNCPTACTQCERYGGGCTGPCKNPRYYGPHCRTSCSSSCTDVCNRITGECGSCEPGYMGDKCDVTCPPNCRDGCDKDTGECGSCEPGYTGDKCDVTCSSNCRDGCDKDTGECDSCEPGYTGDKCDVTCSSNCRDGCDKDTGECGSCEPGYRGKYCDSCEPGYRGKYCNDSCPSQCTECQQHGVNCIGQCHRWNYHGTDCTLQCPVQCRGCVKETGLCAQCAEQHCRAGCGDQCTPCKGEDCHSPTCKMICPANCVEFHFFSKTCNTPCINKNYFGQACNIPCFDKCDTCDKDTGKCISCRLGLRGELCDDTCPSNCTQCERYGDICIGACPNSGYYGRDCSIQCPVSCEGCHKKTGLCMKCAEGFSRTYCDEICSPCSENTCYRTPCRKR